jgi:hypothetical protein
MTFTVPYRRESVRDHNALCGDDEHSKWSARYVVDFNDSPIKKGDGFMTVILSDTKTPEEHLAGLLDTVRLSVGLFLSVHRSKVKCEYGNGGIAVTVEEQVA